VSRVRAAALAVGLVLLAPAAATARPDVRLASGPLTGRVIALDPGHNGGNARRPDVVNRLVWAGTHRKACDTVGASTADGYPEAAFTWDVAVRLRRLLEARGARVVLTRRSNVGVGPCITERAAIGNRARAHAALSIHADGAAAGVRGFHVIHPVALRGLTTDIAAPSARLARSVRDAYAARTGLPPASYAGRAGLHARGDLGGLNLSDVPKVFVECGNLRNARDARLLGSPAFRQRIAVALAEGLGRHLGRRGA
jgi:N-acetylmuramoyl-L-alanine amidase